MADQSKFVNQFSTRQLDSEAFVDDKKKGEIGLTSLRSARSHLVSTFKCGSSSCTIALRLRSAPLTNLAGSVMNVASSKNIAQTL